MIRQLIHLSLVFAVLFFCLSRCSTLGPQGRRFLDSSTRKDSPPEWVRETKTGWERDGKVYLHSFHTIRGDERVNGCFDLVRLDNKEALLSEIANEVKGSIDNAQQSISESAEAMLGKVRAAEFSGRISGLRFTDEYFERYRIGETEKVDCHILSEIKETDYNRIKREVVDKIAEVDPRLKEAISKKQIDFFSNGKQKDPVSQKNNKGNDTVKELKDAVKSELEHYFKLRNKTETAKATFDDLEVKPRVQGVATQGTLDQIRENVAKIARAFTGIRYEMGGDIASSGKTDCSAFTRKVYEIFGVGLPRTSLDQFHAKNSDAVGADLLPGDLVFFDGFRGRGVVSHVGLYLGENEFISANGDVGRVTIDTFEEPKWKKKFLGARRVITPKNFPGNRAVASAGL